MTRRAWLEDTGMRIALAALVLAAAGFAWALTTALRPDSVAAASSVVSVVPGALDAPVPGPRVSVEAAVAADLFSPTRTAPSVAYRPPGDAVPASAPAPQAPPTPVVLGTAIAVDGSSFATCQFASSRLLMVRVGDHVGSYVVKSIERGSVVFATPSGKTLEIFAPRPGS
jgi:hypothetical protein